MKPLIAAAFILALLYRAYSHKSLTPLGLFTAFLTAVIHALHPWSTPFTLLGTFFLLGTWATKVKHAEKARLTQSASGAPSGTPEARTHVQVLANSLAASVLILAHMYLPPRPVGPANCFNKSDVLIYGIVGNYAATAADTLSSELGILSPTPPRLVTSLTLRVVPRGTNGGVTLVGLAAGAFGAAVIGVTAALGLPFCSTQWSWADRGLFVAAVTLWGTLGSLLDSVLGGLLQRSVVDGKTGKVIEGAGGRTVLVTADGAKGKKGEVGGSRRVESGREILDNNGVNLLMACIMSVGAVAVAGVHFEVDWAETLGYAWIWY